MHDIRNMEVFKHARRLVRLVYEETRHFPRDERFLLVSQMRGCSNSIGANLMEGSGRDTRGEVRQFAGMSSGSAYELEWHTIIAGDLRYLPKPNQDALLHEIHVMKKLLHRFRESLR